MEEEASLTFHEGDFPTRVVVCQKPWKSSFCINEEAEVPSSMTMIQPDLTSQDCIQFCRHKNKQLSYLSTDTINTKTMCKCLSKTTGSTSALVASLFEKSILSKGSCSLNSFNGMIGSDFDESAVYINDHFRSTARSCSELSTRMKVPQAKGFIDKDNSQKEVQTVKFIKQFGLDL